MGEEQRLALSEWSNRIQVMLDSRYGKGRTGNIIIVFPIGRAAKLSWISTATFSSVIAILEFLLKHLKEENTSLTKVDGGMWLPD